MILNDHTPFPNGRIRCDSILTNCGEDYKCFVGNTTSSKGKKCKDFVEIAKTKRKIKLETVIFKATGLAARAAGTGGGPLPPTDAETRRRWGRGHVR